jgi:small subunit ribosomal protein S16
MAAKIRLKRVGRKGQPSYRIVVLDGQKPRDAKVVEDLGFYDPKTNPPTFEVDSETALKWLLDGAKATSAARSVLSKAGVMAAWDAAKRGEEIAIQPKELKPSTKRKKEEEPTADEEKAEESTEEPTEGAVEEPAEEPAQETEEASEPVAEEDAAPEREAVPEEDAADEAPEEAPESEGEVATEADADAEAEAEEEPEAEEPADDAEEKAKEEA